MHVYVVTLFMAGKPKTVFCRSPKLQLYRHLFPIRPHSVSPYLRQNYQKMHIVLQEDLSIDMPPLRSNPVTKSAE